jgi:hypothetical protein
VVASCPLNAAKKMDGGCWVGGGRTGVLLCGVHDTASGRVLGRFQYVHTMDAGSVVQSSAVDVQSQSPLVM